MQQLLLPTAADGHVRRAGEGVRGRSRHSVLSSGGKLYWCGVRLGPMARKQGKST